MCMQKPLKEYKPAALYLLYLQKNLKIGFILINNVDFQP